MLNPVCHKTFLGNITIGRDIQDTVDVIIHINGIRETIGHCRRNQLHGDKILQKDSTLLGQERFINVGCQMDILGQQITLGIIRAVPLAQNPLHRVGSGNFPDKCQAKFTTPKQIQG